VNLYITCSCGGKLTLETSREDVKSTLQTSGEDVKSTLGTSGEDRSQAPWQIVELNAIIRKRLKLNTGVLDELIKRFKKVNLFHSPRV
jgi:hypothetical protein